MKISNSKKQLAKIISENGGWREGAEFSAQDRLHALVDFYEGRPRRDKDDDYWHLPGGRLKAETFEAKNVIANWHQTILSRDEYFHLYPAPYADGWIEWKGGECPVKRGALVDVKYANGVTNYGVSALTDKTSADHASGSAGSLLATNWSSGLPMSGIIAYRPHKPEQSKSTAVGDDETNLAAKEELEALEFEPIKPTIEQLAADYRAKLAIAQQAQEEADSHRCVAEAALDRLYQAGLAIGLDIAIADSEQEGEKRSQLVITDWRDLQVGDVIEVPSFSKSMHAGCEGVVSLLVAHDLDHAPVKAKFGQFESWVKDWRFIRRP